MDLARAVAMKTKYLPAARIGAVVGGVLILASLTGIADPWGALLVIIGFAFLLVSGALAEALVLLPRQAEYQLSHPKKRK